MTRSATETAVDAFARKTTLCAFAVGLLRGLAVVTAAAAAALLLLRAFGGYLAPSPWWALAALPAIAFAVFHARRQALGPAAAAHLDRRLGLDGLLLATLESEPPVPVWQARVLAALPRARGVAPRVTWRPLLPPAALGGLLLTGAAMLPPPDPLAPTTVPTAVQMQVDRLAEKLRDLQQALPEDTREDLEQKLQEFARRLDAGDVPEWTELDRVQDRLEREQLLQLAQERAAADAARAMQQSGSSNPATAEAVAALAKAMAAAGLLDKLPPSAMQALAQAALESGFDPAQLPQDAAALQALADALAAAAGDLEAGPAGLDAAQLADLQQLLQQRGLGQGQEHVHGPECAGGT
ncbi:MAG: hypothetical protein IPK26_06710 [Planctomycetes bacterium]|nr:hypothetical protein [Planctomycetota bacterium]